MSMSGQSYLHPYRDAWVSDDPITDRKSRHIVSYFHNVTDHLMAGNKLRSKFFVKDMIMHT